MKIVDIRGNRAVAEAEGVKREIGIELLKDAKLGEYVMVHAGYAIEKIETAEAQETIKIFEEYKDALRKGFKK
jgi:hydrogenase expression/formation protein HypC